MLTKPGKKEFLKLYIGLLSCHLTSPGWLARLTGFIGACQLGPQKDNVGIHQFFFPCFLLSKSSKIYFFQRYNASTFLSLDSRCGLNQEKIQSGKKL